MKLYALCDATTLKRRGMTLADFVLLAKKNSASVIQYRNKEDNLSIIKSEIVQLRKLWDDYLIINDHIELVPFCDGIHLGQDDVLRYAETVEKGVKEIRKMIKNDKIFGLSTHNKEEIEIANGLDINYIGLGAYRATQTKEVTDILGNKLDTLAALSHHPVAAIGGVKITDRFEHVTYNVVGSGLYEY